MIVSLYNSILIIIIVGTRHVVKVIKCLVCSFVILILNIYIQDCPLSKMEHDRLGTCMTDIVSKVFYRKDYDSKTRYIVQTGAIIFMLSLLCVKGLVLLLKRNIKPFLLLLDD